MAAAAAAALLVTAAALLGVCPASAFVQLMGNSDIYCDSEGSYCRSDSSCCDGLACVPRYSRMGGGVCQRREQRQHEAAEATAADYAYPRYPASSVQHCQADADCAASQCCVRRSGGPRASGISVCSTDCSDKEAGNILADFYSRYYRRSARRDAAGKLGSGGSKPHHRHVDSDGKKKKKTV